MPNPRLSVITPTYNHETFIEKCMLSVVAQTYEDWEMIVVDDGSTDGTWPIVERVAALDPRIRAFRQENKGIWRLHETYNFALARARGSHVAILEGDDYWPEDKLLVQLEQHEKDTVLSYGKVAAVHPDGTIRYLQAERIRGSVSREFFQEELLLKRAAVQPVSLIVNRQSLTSIGGFRQDGFFAVDLPTLLSLASTNGRFVYVHHLLGYWRVHEMQMTNQVMSLSTELVEKRVEADIRLRLSAARAYGYSETRIAAVQRVASASAADAYLQGVRQYFARGKREPATLRFLLHRLWRYGTRLRKLQVVYGYACHYAGLDFEWPFHVHRRWIRSKTWLSH